MNARDERTGATALVWAVGGNKTNVAQLLIANGADPNLADNAGRTPLMLAVSLGNEVLVRGLLAAKADPSAADSEGMTAKDWAEKHKRPELIELLALPKAGG